MVTKAKTKQTINVKTVDTPSDLPTINDNQSGLFDYSSLDANTAKLAKESAIEIKAREKAIWENIIEIGNRLIEVKNALPHGKFGEWVKLEFEWHPDTAGRYIKISEEIDSNPIRRSVLPNSFKALYQLASALGKADDETKEEILTAVEQKTEQKGKALTEKEIKEAIATALGQVKKILDDPREAVKHTNEDLAIQFDLPLEVVTATRENIEYKRGEEILRQERDDLRKKIADNQKVITDLQQKADNQHNDIQRLNSEISVKQKQLDSLDKEKEQLKTDKENLDEKIKKEADKIVKEELKKKQEILANQEAELKKKEAQINSDLKKAESLKTTAQRQKENLDSTTVWLNNFHLTNEYLNDVVNEIKKYKKELQKTPDLSQLDDELRTDIEKRIKDQIVNFNDNLHDLGGAINYLNGTVVKFNNHALRVLDAEVVSND